MICNNCGKIVEDNAAFCTNCGTKLEAPAAAEPENNTFSAPEQPASAPEFQNTFDNNGGIYEKPFNAAPEQEKTYFGKGALVFCLVVIGLLAISTGVFAGLYFSAV